MRGCSAKTLAHSPMSGQNQDNEKLSAGRHAALMAAPHPLMSVLTGSCFKTRRDHTFCIVQAVVRGSGKEAESPYVLVERTKDGRCARVLLTVGILVNQVRGSLHTPGMGRVIDWASVERQPQIRSGLAAIYSPSLLGRTDQNGSSRRLRPAS